MSKEQSIGVAVDGVGKKVRNLEVVTVINNVPVTVEMQVIAIADEDGNILNASDLGMATKMPLILHYLQRICGAIETLTDGIIYAEKAENLDDPSIDTAIPITT